MNRHTFILTNTTHGQFHLIDDESYPDPSEAWTDEACANRVATTEGFVGIGVLQDCPEVEVTLVIGQTCSREEIDACDHVVKCSLQIYSGRLLISPCIPMSDDEIYVVAMNPGCYRLCILCDWFDTTKLDQDERRREQYTIFMWPSQYQSIEVTKRRVWDSAKKGWSDIQHIN